MLLKEHSTVHSCSDCEFESNFPLCSFNGQQRRRRKYIINSFVRKKASFARQSVFIWLSEEEEELLTLYMNSPI